MDSKLNMIPLEYTGRPVRVVIIDGEPWFVAKDVCDVLGIINHRYSCSALSEDEVGKTYITDSLNRKQETLIISEPGLYYLIARSNKSDARVFDRWIRHDVLPQIRKTGSYHGQLLLPDIIENRLERIETEQRRQGAIIIQLRDHLPKASYGGAYRGAIAGYEKADAKALIQGRNWQAQNDKRFKQIENELQFLKELWASSKNPKTWKGEDPKQSWLFSFPMDHPKWSKRKPKFEYNDS